MPCCGSARSSITGQQHSANNRISTGQNGVYELYNYPEQFDPYNGLYRADTIFVAGYQTEHERLFKKVQSKEALAYAKRGVPGEDLTLWQAPVTMICSAAIEDLYSTN